MENIDKLSVSELKNLCKECRLRRYHGLKKSELVGILTEHYLAEKQRTVNAITGEAREKVGECIVCLETLRVHNYCSCSCFVCIRCFVNVDKCPQCRIQYINGNNIFYEEEDDY